MKCQKDFWKMSQIIMPMATTKSVSTCLADPQYDYALVQQPHFDIKVSSPGDFAVIESTVLSRSPPTQQ
jgi:hypothetical protein